MLVRRGDTIVEVTLAFTIFTVLAVGSIVIMNHGVAMAQRSLEETQVRQVIDGQTDLLRVAQNTTVWDTIKSNAVTAAGDIVTSSDVVAGCPSTSPKKSFIITRDGAKTNLQYVALTNATNFAAAPVTSYIDFSASKALGIWIQAVKVSGAPAAYDMYIRACWNTTNGNIPATLATIVRLYDAN